MKRRRWAVIGLVVLALGAGLGTAGVSCIRSKGPTPEQVERQIRADVPLGTPRSAVESYLRSRGIWFRATTMNSPEITAKAGLADREIRETIQANVKPAFVSLVLPGYVSVYFFFDREDRLLGYHFVSIAPTP